MKLLLSASALAFLLASPALAQETAVDDVRVNQLIVYGDDPCPPSTNDQINICAIKREEERFRIPENLRGDPNDPANLAWAARATELQYLGSSGIGSCSTSGPGGSIGCFNQIVREARADRATRDEVNWNRLIEEARQERLAKIQAEAEEESRRGE